jgi:bacterioferritin-associated ferredoxin
VRSKQPSTESCGYCGTAAPDLWGPGPPAVCAACLEVARQILDPWSAPENEARADAYGKDDREKAVHEGTPVPSCSFCGSHADDLLARDLHVVASGRGLFICDPCVRGGLAAFGTAASSPRLDV